MQLAPFSASDDFIAVGGKDVQIIGFGTTFSGGDISSALLDAAVQLMNVNDCRDTVYGNEITDDMICAVVGGGVDSCQGEG